MLFVGLAMFGTFFYVSLYMQNVLHYSPVEAGASFLPMTMPDHPDRAAAPARSPIASAPAGSSAAA